MKIVYICNEINLKSGWGVLNYHTIKQASMKNEVTVFTLNNAVNINIENVKIYPILTSMQDGKLKFIKICYDKYNIKRLINTYNVEIVHVLVEPLLPLIELFKKSKKIFAIVGTYAIHPLIKSTNSKIYQNNLKSVDNIVSISEYTKKLFIEKNGHLKDKTITIPLGVDFERFNNKSMNTSREKAFIFVGHIKPRKGLIYALKAFKKLNENYQNLKFKIVGAKSFSKYEEECKNYVLENQLENVYFLGSVSDEELLKLYNSSMCNVLTSINDGNAFEGFGLIHLEANACGLPTIGSRECGNESAIVDGVTGFLCFQKDIDDIYLKMKRITEDYENGNYTIWTNNCFEYAKKNDWSQYFNKLVEEVYKR